MHFTGLLDDSNAQSFFSHKMFFAFHYEIEVFSNLLFNAMMVYWDYVLLVLPYFVNVLSHTVHIF